MQKLPLIFLRAAIVLIGATATAFLLWEPHLEGRNAHATLFQIYFNDPFLAYAYLASIPFFLILYQVYGLLGYARQATQNLRKIVNALRTITYCAGISVGFVIVGDVFIVLGSSDDHAGGVFMGMLAVLGFVGIATFSTVLSRKYENMLDVAPRNKTKI